MNSLNPCRWQKNVPLPLHAVVPHHRFRLDHLFKMLSITFLWLTCQSPNHAIAEISEVNYAIPPPLEMPTDPIEIKEPQGILSLSKALSLALLHNPKLTTFAWEVRASEVRALRAGLLPNPDIGVEIENFAGSGKRKAFDQTETTLALSQLIELGGKRMKRRALANTQRDLAAWDYEAKRLDVLSNVTTAFVEVLAGQTRLKLAEETVSLANSIYRSVEERVRAGKVSPLEQSKSRVELARARLIEAKIRRELVAARQDLAAIWGSMTPQFDAVTGELETDRTPPSLASLVDRLSSNPDLARWTAEMSLRRKALNLAKAGTIPDITLSAGVRRFADEDDFAGVASFSVPLFVFDNKKTEVQEAEIGLTQAMQNRKTAMVMIRAELVDAYQRLQMAFVEIEAIRNEVLPSAEAAFDAATEAYRLGKIGSIDLLDAQRTLFQTRREQVEALVVFHRNVVSIERLIGGEFNVQSTQISESNP